MEEIQYEKMGMIKQGNLGYFHWGINTKTKQIIAIQTVPITDKLEGVPRSVLDEVSLVKGLQHTNIIRLLAVQVQENTVDLIYEHTNTDLHRLIHPAPGKNRIIKPPLIKKILYQVLSGLSNYHSRKIIHRDIKPRNVLIDTDTLVVKIADLWLTKKFCGQGCRLGTELTRVGNRGTRAPEILLGATNYSGSADIWSVGCLFYEMMTGKLLFSENTLAGDTLCEIFSIFGMPTEDTWPGVTFLPGYHSVRQQFLVYKGEKKNIMSLCSDAGLEEVGVELLSKMLCMNPSARVSTEDAIKDPYLMDMMAV
ncbi:cell division control protein 2 homolog isoform X2 [Mercurialis annua]|uniref:cell division control protein 2 homolog isoform X2 n=1 Tax=Mercurialis annua TaxID=3986 RepID=UPI00215E43CC|nr:cell division control protein 2 homolog isoform X2 [Mercurialis annua]